MVLGLERFPAAPWSLGKILVLSLFYVLLNQRGFLLCPRTKGSVPGPWVLSRLRAILRVGGGVSLGYYVSVSLGHSVSGPSEAAQSALSSSSGGIVPFISVSGGFLPRHLEPELSVGITFSWTRDNHRMPFFMVDIL